MTLTQERVSISVPEAADLIGISERKAYYLAGRNELPGAYHFAGRLLVHVATLLADLESRATTPATSSPGGPVGPAAIDATGPPRASGSPGVDS